MTPLDHSTLRGNWATLLLPIMKDNSIDYAALEDEIAVLIDAKVDGIYSNGTAGEFISQTEEEFDAVSVLLAERCNAAGVPFQIGCSHVSPQVSLARVKRSVALKPSGVQVILPDWSPPSMGEILDYLRVMEEAADGVALVLYNPPHAKVRLTPEEYGQIRAAGIRLAGCKVAGGDRGWYAAMKAANPELAIFVPGHTLATGIASGAHGAYSNVACLNPRVAQWWYGSMLTDMPKALELEKRIQYFITTYIVPYITTRKFSNTAADKFLAAVGEWAPLRTRVRWPYASIPEDEVGRTRIVCRQIIPEFFERSPT